MSSRKSAVVLALAIFATTTPLHAAETYCSGKLNEMLVYSDGTLMVHSTWRNDWTVLCNIKGTFGGIDAVTCSMWAALAGKVVETQQFVIVYYPNSAACTALTTYGSSSAPGYFRTAKK